MTTTTSNEVPILVVSEPLAPVRVGLEVEVYDGTDPTQKLETVVRRWDVSTMDEIAKPGTGAFAMWRHDPLLTLRPNLLSYRNVVKFRLNGTCVGGCLLTNRDSSIVAKAEESGEQIAVSGEGLRAWFHDAAVLPYNGLKPRSSGSRVFSFASERGSWYNAADWVTPVNVQQYDMDPNTGPWNTAPAQWPDAPSAWWIWGVANSQTLPAPAGYNYFRYEFTIADTVGSKSYSVFAAGDNNFWGYIDGQEILTATDSDSYAKTWRADFDLDPGSHVLAFKVFNAESSPAGLIAALFQAGDAANNVAAQLLSVTGDAGWVVNPYPDPAPGWTAGEIVLTLMSEAQARGVRFPNFLTPTFTAAVDSNGTPWTRALDWSFTLGTEMFEVIQRLEEAVCDLWVDPETLNLNMYVTRGTHKDTQSQAVSPVKFEIGKNVTRASEKGTSEIKNTLILETSDGWELQADATSGSINTYGRIEGSLNTGLSASVSGDVAQAVFGLKAQPTRGVVYEIIDVDFARPFVDFGVGDWVLAPSAADDTTLEPTRVMSIAVTEDPKTGIPKYAVEFGTIIEDQTDKHERWLKILGNNALGGSVFNAAGSTGSSATQAAQTTSTGPMGLQGPAGPAGIIWRGTWDVSLQYKALDAVKYNGAVWYALLDNSGTTPVEGATWTMLVDKGTDGTNGESAYQLAVDGGYVGTQTQWLASLVGPKGDKGDTGPQGSIAPRFTTSYTTASLASNAVETGVIALGNGFRLYRIDTSGPARVRLYGTPAYQSADLSRPVGTDPVGDHGLLFEYVTSASVLGAFLSPLVDGASFENPASANIALSITNLGSAAAAITLTLVWAKTE